MDPEVHAGLLAILRLDQADLVDAPSPVWGAPLGPFASAVGGATGVLTHLAGDSQPAAAPAAGAAFAASTAIFHRLVGRS